MLGIVVALFVGYWLIVVYVLLPASRVTKPADAKAGLASTNGPSVTGSPQGSSSAPASTTTNPPGLVSGIREALASTDERLTGPRGTFGDMFGAVNALFAGLAFACVFYTILQQREDLRLQREDLAKRIEGQLGKVEEQIPRLEDELERLRRSDGPEFR